MTKNESIKCFYCGKEATQESTDLKSIVYHCNDCGFELISRYLKKFPGTLICTKKLLF
jgi:uncharacterized Zn finger protein